MAELWPKLPLMEPPLGVTPNFANPQNRTKIFVVYAVFTSLVVLFVSLRLYAKIWITRLIGWDDCKCTSILEKNGRADGFKFLVC